VGFFSFITAPFKAAAKVVSWVGDALADVVEFAVEEIFEPIIDVVGGIVEGMISDPLTTIATIVAFATGNAWAIPIIQGASTAAHGGDLGDIAKAVAGKAAASQAAGMGFSAGTQQVVAQVAQQATSSAIRAVAAGGDAGDILKAAATGAVTAGVAAGLDYAVDSYTPTITGEGAETALGFNVNTAALEKFTDVSNSIGIELGDIAAGWDALPETVRNVITAGAAASVTSLATTGEIDKDQVAGAISRAVITTNITANTLGKIPNVSDKQAAILSKVAGDVVASAYTGVDPYQAYQASIAGATLGDLFAEIDTIVGGSLDLIGRTIDDISGASAEVATKRKILTDQITLRDKATTVFNAAVKKTNDAVNAYKAHVIKYNEEIRHGPKPAADAYRATHIDSFVNDTYPKLTAEVNKAREEYDALNYGIPKATNDYAEAQKALYGEEQKLETAIAPVEQKLTEKVVRTLKPDFDPDFVEVAYLADPRIASGELPAFTDPYNFWLDTGRRLAVSAEEYDRKVEEYVHKVIGPDILANLSDYTGRYSDLGDFGALVEHVKERIGPNLIAIQTDWDGVDGETLVKTAAQEWFDTQAPYELPAIAPEEGQLVVPTEEGLLSAIALEEGILPAVAPDEGPTDIGPEEEPTEPARRRLTEIPIKEGMDHAKIASGEARLAFSVDENTGQLGVEWTDEPPETKIQWISALNRVVEVVGETIISPAAAADEPDGFFTPTPEEIEEWNLQYDRTLGKWISEFTIYKFVDPETDETIEGYEKGTQNPDGTITFEREDGTSTSVIEAIPTPAPIGIDELGREAPLIAMDTLQNLEINEEAYEELDAWAKFILNRAIDIKDVTDWLVENETELREEFGFEVPEGELISDRWRKNISTVVGAYSEQAEQLSGWVSFLGEDARKGELNKVAKAVSLAMVAINPPEYNAIVAELDGIIGAKEDWMDKAQALGSAFLDDRYTEAIAREYLAKEILQEGPLIIASGGTGLLVKSGIKYGTKALAKAGVVEFTKEVAEQAAKKWGLYAAIGANAVQNFVETAASNGGETHAEVYDEEYKIRKIEGATDEEAHESATRIARRAAVINGLLTGSVEAVLGNLPGVSSRKFSEAIAGGSKRLGSALDVVKSMALEGIGEATEETLGLLYKVGVLKEINPAIVEEGGRYSDLGGNIAAAQIIGFFVGAHTSGALSVAHKAYELGTEEGDPFFGAGMDFPTEDQAFDQQFTGAGMDFLTATGDPIANIFADVNPTINEALRNVQSSDLVIREEGINAIKNAFGWDTLPPINMVQDEEGVWTKAPAVRTTALALLNHTDLPQEVRDRFTTSGEVERAFELNKTPYVYTPADIYPFTGETPTADLPAIVEEHIDDRSITFDEVQTTAAEEGYFGISPEDAKPFIGQGDADFDESTRTTVTNWADEHAVTSDEVTTSLGSLRDPITNEPIPFTAGPDEFEQFIGQGGPTFEQDVLKPLQLLDYTKDRQLTPRNIREIYEREGTIATEADIARLRGQGGPEFRSEREAEIQAEQDPLAVTPQETRDIYTEMGLDAPITAKDAARLAGQYPEAELEERATEFLPIATANATAAIFGKRGQDVTREEVAFVEDLIAQQAVLTEAGTALQPLTSQQLAYDVNNDGVVNEADQSILEQVRTGAISQADIVTQSPFAATGIQAQLQQAAMQAAEATAIQTAQTTAIQSQIAAQTAADEERRRMQAQNQYLAQVMETTPVQVITPPPAEIKYVYDPFGESIFATPEQESLFGGLSPFPFATPTGNAPFTLPMQTVSGGGIIEDKTDEILRALGENR